MPIFVLAVISLLTYLLKHFGTEPLETELAGYHEKRGDRKPDSLRTYQQTNRVMDYLDLDDDIKNASTTFHASRTLVPTQGHAWMLDYNFYGYRSNSTTSNYSWDETKLSLITDKDANFLIIKANDTEVIEIDLASWVADVKAAIKENGRNSESPLVWHADQNGWRFSFVCTNAQLKNNAEAFQSARLNVFFTPPE